VPGWRARCATRRARGRAANGAGRSAAELEQLAVRALLALEEPHREALLLRYLRGLEPAEIAARQGVPASTVRTRIARGLELVRTRLDARHGGRREAWLALSVPFERDLAPAAPSARGTAAGVAAGGALRVAKWLAGGALVALAGLGWWNRGPSERANGRTHAVASNTRAEPSAPGAGRELEPVLPARESRGAARTPLAPAAASLGASATASLSVHVTFAHDGAPAAGGTVEVLSWDAPLYPRARTAVAGADGRVEFTGLEPGRQIVEERRANGGWIEVPSGEARAYELVIPAGIDVDLCVVDAEGVPVPRAEVWLSDHANSTDGGVLGRTGADGRLFVRDVGESRSLAARAEGHVPSAQRDVLGNPGDTGSRSRSSCAARARRSPESCAARTGRRWPAPRCWSASRARARSRCRTGRCSRHRRRCGSGATSWAASRRAGSSRSAPCSRRARPGSRRT
jgi:hypothetical protein